MTGARWLADERHGLHDLGERQQPPVAQPEQSGPPSVAPRSFPFIDCMGLDSFREWLRIVADAGLVQ